MVAGSIWVYRYWTHGRCVQSTNNAYLQADQVTLSEKVAGRVMQVFVRARQAAIRAARIAHQRYAGGTSNLIDALDADRQRAQADDQWVQAGSDLMVAYATLQKSLGVGWGAAAPADGAPR